jgi:phospholipid/cholesterol/gamma-HCH transport system permease protein
MLLESKLVDGGVRELRPSGAWVAAERPALERAVAACELGGERAVLDGAGLGALDLTGAWFLHRLEQRLADAGIPHDWRPARPEALVFTTTLLAGGGPAEAPAPAPAPARPPPGELPLDLIGRWAVRRGSDLHDAFEFLGRIYFVLGGALRRPARLRGNSIVRHVYETGIQAIPIVALIAFLISVIVAYIGAQELRQFGGDVFVVDLVTVSVLRELGVLLTAIIVAGRSGSAFAAEIGVMRLNEEVDALRAIGINVVEVLVVPRVLGLIIALPLLTIVADAMGLAGGAVLSWLLLDIPFNQFLVRMQDAMSSTTFWAGLLKAPVFAFVISVVGTFRGIQVRESSRELGRLTTVAVVESIFLVLLVDAVFAVVYWELDF